MTVWRFTRLPWRASSGNCANRRRRVNILEFVEIELTTQGFSSQEIIQNEYQAQSADDVSVRNVITAMRLVSNIDWAEFFESVSLVDGVLGENADFHALDFTTRDRYRQAIERLARRAPFDEIQVARMAIEQAGGRPRNRRVSAMLASG